jgi:malate dehydrogenase (oxaloacetate-decarboxylating)(NADP+)
METGVARRTVDIAEYREHLQAGGSRGWRVVHSILEKAQQTPRRLVFAEGEHPTILRAVQQMKAEGLSEPILLGNRETISARIKDLGLRIRPKIIEPGDSKRLGAYAEEIYRLRQRKGVTRQRADEMVRDPNIFGLMMVRMGDADGFVSGLTYEYPAVVRPTLQLIRTRPGVSTMVGAYIVVARGRAYVFADALINVDPDPARMAEIAILTAGFVRQLDIEPHVAMISFSNFGSVPGTEPEKVQQALRIAREREPDLNIDGEMQVDTALSGEIMEEYYPFSQIRNANTLIFPNLDAANSSLKLLSQLGDVEVIGPILVGANQPVQVLQHAATVQDVVRMAALTAMDAQDLEQRG